MPLPIINAIWIGKQMGAAQAACLASFVRTDHKVILHAYGTVDDAPRGIIYADANELRPEDQLLRYANGSLALSSNLMRYELLRQGLGLYIDCDVYCVAPFEDSDAIFGLENPETINSAVMKLAQDSPVLAELCRIQPGWVPDWWSEDQQRQARSMPWTEMQWGATGPLAVTHYLQKHAMMDRAQPADVFYPVPYQSWRNFYDARVRLEELVTPRTRYVHLYREMARPDGVVPAPGSPLDLMIRREGVA
jgi:hypothetical protein